MALGNQIRKYRAAAGITLERLAELSSVDVGTISALELRNSKKSNYTTALAAAFGLTVEQLVDDSTLWPVTIAEATAPANHVADGPPAPRITVTWPFRQVSYGRIQHLKSILGKNAGDAMRDIDELLDVAVSRWELRAQKKDSKVA